MLEEVVGHFSGKNREDHRRPPCVQAVDAEPRVRDRRQPVVRAESEGGEVGPHGAAGAGADLELPAAGECRMQARHDVVGRIREHARRAAGARGEPVADRRSGARALELHAERVAARGERCLDAVQCA